MLSRTTYHYKSHRVNVTSESRSVPTHFVQSCRYIVRKMVDSLYMWVNKQSKVKIDLRFIRKILQSDWLDYGTWTIFTFMYKRSSPFIRLLIMKDFRRNQKRAIGRESRQVFLTDVTEIMFGKFSLFINFRKTFLWKN